MARRNSQRNQLVSTGVRCVTQQTIDLTPNLDDEADKLDPKLKKGLKVARINPIKATNEAAVTIGRSRQEHDEASLLCSVVAYEAAQQMKGAPSHWKIFLNDPGWSKFTGHRPKIDEEKDHLKWVMIFVHHAVDKRGKERANVYRGALQMAFDRGVEAERLPSLIFQQGGIDKAYRTALKLKRSGNAPTSEQDLPSSGEASDTKADQGEADGEQLSGSAEPSSGAESHSLPFDEPTISDLTHKMANIMRGGYEPMLVALQPHDLHKVIGRYVETGEVTLRCKLVRDDDDGWVEVTCMRAWRSHRKP